MNLLFDTSVIIALEKEDKNTLKLVSELSKKYCGTPYTTFISYYEFLFGIQNRNPKNKENSIEFLNKFNCLHATKKTAEIMQVLRKKCEIDGVVINLADLIIASQAKEHNMTLLSKDKVFEKIEDIDKIILS